MLSPLLTKHHLLFGTRSVVGALAVVLALSWFGFGLEAIDDAVTASNGFTIGETYDVSATVAFTPVDGWVLDPEQTVPEIAVVAHKNGWEQKLAAGLTLAPDQTVEDFAAIFRDVSDPSVQVGDLQTFTTTSGLNGVRWEVHGANDVTVTWLIVNGTNMVQQLATGSSSTYASVEDELDQMAASVTIEDAGSEG